MAKKSERVSTESVVDQELLRKAKLVLESETPRVASRCVICGGDAAPTSAENLCWVCRRLKISAWRDSDQQMTAQE